MPARQQIVLAGGNVQGSVADRNRPTVLGFSDVTLYDFGLCAVSMALLVLRTSVDYGMAALRKHSSDFRWQLTRHELRHDERIWAFL